MRLSSLAAAVSTARVSARAPRESRAGRAGLAAMALLCAAPLACGGAGAQGPSRPPLAEQWLTRAQASYKAGDFEDARDAAKSALQASPSDPDIRLLNARIALAKLDYDDAIKLTE